MPVLGFPRSPDEPVPGSPDEARAALAAGAPSRQETRGTELRSDSTLDLGRGDALTWALRVRGVEHRAWSMARTSVAAGVAAWEEGSGARSMTLLF